MRAHPAQLCSRMLLWLVYACSSCAAFFPAAPGWPAWMRHICCARGTLAKKQGKNLGTLAKKQGNNSFKSYKVARCPQAPSFPWAPRRGRPRAPSPPAPAPPAPPAPRPCVSKSCYIALNHEDVLVVDRSYGSEEALSGCWCWHRNENRIYDVPVVLSRCSKGQQLKKHMKIEN